MLAAPKTAYKFPHPRGPAYPDVRNEIVRALTPKLTQWPRLLARAESIIEDDYRPAARQGIERNLAAPTPRQGEMWPWPQQRTT
jgi:hypothetical protein